MMTKQKLVLFFTVFIDMICFSMIFPVLPYLVDELHFTKLSIGLLVTIFPLMNFLCNSYWGSLSDRVGRRPIMLASIAITFFANILLGFCNGFLLLFVARLLAGVGSANISVAQAAITDISTPETRTKNLGLMGAMFGMGFIIGPYVGSVLKMYSGAGSALYVGLGAAALNLINYCSATYYLTESNLSLNKAKKTSFNPFINIIKWLKVPVVQQLMVLFCIYVVAFSMMQITSGFLWKQKYHLTEKQAGLMFVYIGLTSALFQGLLVGRLTKNYNERQLIIGGGIIMSLGLTLIPVPNLSNFWVIELFACTLLSLGNACITPPLQSWLTKKSPTTEIGQVLGANQSFGSLGRVVGPALGTFLYAYNVNVPFYVSGALMLLPLFIIIRLKT